MDFLNIVNISLNEDISAWKHSNELDKGIELCLYVFVGFFGTIIYTFMVQNAAASEIERLEYQIEILQYDMKNMKKRFSRYDTVIKESENESSDIDSNGSDADVDSINESIPERTIVKGRYNEYEISLMTQLQNDFRNGNLNDAINGQSYIEYIALKLSRNKKNVAHKFRNDYEAKNLIYSG